MNDDVIKNMTMDKVDRNKSDSNVRLFVVGGFLGSGKTTALIALSEYFTRQNLRVAVITNDQTDGLVDSEIVRIQGIQYREISGACFCTRFRDFLEAADTLLQETRPDVILTEPVGSAADLIATVIKPLRAYTQDRYTVMPLTVLVDPSRVGEMIQQEAEKVESIWPEDIRYLYERQMREADFLLLSKADITGEREMESARQSLHKLYETYRPTLPIQSFSARTGEGLREWLHKLETMGTGENISNLEFDRDRHARAESALGWLNLEANLIHPRQNEIDAIAFVQGFLQRLKDRLQNAPVGHLKLFVQSNHSTIKASVVDWRLGYHLDKLQVSDTIIPPAENRSKILINIRSLRDPQDLLQQTTETLEEIASIQNARVELCKENALRPGRPKPTFRIGEISTD